MLKKIGIVLTVAVLGIVLVFPVLPAAAGEMAKEGELKRVRKKVEALRAWRLTDELKLDEETSAKLFPAMREADEVRRRIESRNRELVREMVQQLNGDAGRKGRVDGILDELIANRREMVQAEERHLNRVREILGSEGTARYLMFQMKFEREMKRKAAEAFRERRQGGEGPGGTTDGSRGGATDGNSGSGSDGGSDSGSGGSGSDSGSGGSDSDSGSGGSGSGSGSGGSGSDSGSGGGSGRGR